MSRSAKLFFLLLWLLSGCAGVPPSYDGGAGGQLPPVWRAQGRMVMHNGDDAWHVHFDWQQSGERYTVALSDPLGRQLSRVEGDDGHVLLYLSGRDQPLAGPPQQLLRTHLGWQLPLAGLRYWLTGRVMAGEPVSGRHYDESGRLQRFSQQGWTVRYPGFFDGHAALPRKIGLESPERERPQLSARLVIDRWRLN